MLGKFEKLFRPVKKNGFKIGFTPVKKNWFKNFMPYFTRFVVVLVVHANVSASTVEHELR